MTPKHYYRILKVKGYNKNCVPNQDTIYLQKYSNFITWFLFGGNRGKREFTPKKN